MEKQKKHTPTHLLKLHLSRPRSTWMLVVTEVKLKLSWVAGFGGAMMMDQVLGVKLSDPASGIILVENENGRVEYNGTWVKCGMDGMEWSTEEAAEEEEDAQTW